MSHAIKREISHKTARLTMLRSHIAENLPLAAKNAKEGFFADAARQFEELAIHAHHAYTIRKDLNQLSLDLDRAQSCQLEMSLPPQR